MEGVYKGSLINCSEEVFWLSQRNRKLGDMGTILYTVNSPFLQSNFVIINFLDDAQNAIFYI